MTEKEQIRAEIEKQMKATESGVTIGILSELIGYIDSMPEKLDIDAMVDECMGQNIVLDSMNENTIYDAMDALREVAKTYYRWGIEDACEKLLKEETKRKNEYVKIVKPY